VAPAPILLLPANAQSISNVNPELSWNRVSADPAYTYNVEVGTDAKVTAKIRTATGVTDLFYVVSGDPLASGTTYYWRVQANSGTTLSDWSAIRSFKVDTVAPVDAPVLSAPADALVVTGNPLFSWKSVVDSGRYQLQYATNSTFSAGLYESSALSTLNHKPLAPMSGSYYWRVRALDLAGNAGPWSDYRTVTIYLKPVSGVGPQLLSPANGVILSDRSPTLFWKMASGSSGYRIQVDQNSTFNSPNFDATIPAPDPSETPSVVVSPDLTDGVYYWRVSRIDKNGVQGGWSLLRRFSVNLVIPASVSSSSASMSGAMPGASAASVLTLTWESVDGAVSYQMQLDDAVDFESPLFDESDPATSRSLPPLSDGKYFWRVRAFSEYGASSPWSETWSVEVAAP